MKKRMNWFLIGLAAMLLLACAVVTFASHPAHHPFTVTCPIDGQDMMFDHQVGYGDKAVCWYSHYGTNPTTGEYSKHEAYISCGD